jgi:hypothetical protein
MADDFTERHAGLLAGSYDCVDRVVLNAFFPIGHNPGGFRCWWRRLHGSDDQLDDTHQMRMAGRFARRVRVTLSDRSPLLMIEQSTPSTTTDRKTSAAGAGMPSRARRAAGSIPAAARRFLPAQLRRGRA